MCLAYVQQYKGHSQAVIQHPRMRRILDLEFSAALFDLLAMPTNFRRGLISSALRPGLLRSWGGKGRFYLNVGHTGLNDAGFRTWVRKTNVRPLYLVHDLIPITHPEYCRAGESAKHRERMLTVLDSAVGVIGNSQSTLHELRYFAEAQGRSFPAALSALLGSDVLPASVRFSSRPERPTFVILGTIEARKNHLMLLQVWRRLVLRLGTGAPRLLVIGQRGWECEQVLDLLDRQRVAARQRQ